MTMGTRYEDIAGSLSAARWAAAGEIELAEKGAMLVGLVMGWGERGIMGVMGYLPRKDEEVAPLGGSVRTSSASPYLTASSAVKYLSRSLSAWTRSTVWPVCMAMMRVSSALALMIC